MIHSIEELEYSIDNVYKQDVVCRNAVYNYVFVNYSCSNANVNWAKAQ